ncbi:MAG TPA: FxsC protein [Pyrinomonadaceae bacterium]|nr:FxsC protein [Pyrinomonadaceae bacterium]
MADLWFFLSYARLDRDGDHHKCINKFYEDLQERVRLKIPSADQPGFYDGENIQQGDDWPSALVKALMDTRLIICMYSPSYFSSDYCGRELEIFTRRLMAHANAETDKWPPLILPIMLDPPADLLPLPAAIEDIQMFDDKYPKVYRDNGLRYLLRRNDRQLKNDYEDLLDAVEKKVIALAKKHVLQPLPEEPDIKQVESLFLSSHVAGSGQAQSATSGGSFYADFIYVAGKADEMVVFGREPYYGTDGLDWKPYLPVTDDVDFVAQSVATKERFRHGRISLGADLIKVIKQAQENNRVVIMLVDSWTLCLPEYRDLIQKYDSYSFWNCAVLIPWNDKDDNTVKKRNTLESAIRKAFVTKARSKDPNLFIDTITSYDDLISVLSVTLQRVKLQIIDVTNDFKKIEGETILQPIIAGPGVTSTGNGN